jgi:hypothetical protein
MTDLEPVFNRPVSKSSRQSAWWNQLIALVAVINLGLVIFNLSYIPWRDLYLREFPSIVSLYDPYQGIEPHRVTQRYLHTVDALEQQLHQVDAPATEVESLLADLRSQSVAMIDDNPFLGASKAGTFAKIKMRMRQHIGTDSAKDAFKQFWSADYFATVGTGEALTFFDQQIRPLIETNYFRDIDQNGRFVDKFWRIDIFFTAFFALEFLIRTFLLSTQYADRNWFDAMLQHWYDVLLLLPFWRWLRVIPVIILLHQSNLLNSERIIARITHEPVAHLADKVYKFVMIRFINQTQNAIEEGEVTRFLFKPRKYITINNINEQAVIADRLMQVVIYKVLPQMKPELEALLNHTIEQTFKQSNFYQTFQKVPIIGNMPVEVTEQLATNLAQGVVNVLNASYKDQKVHEIFTRLQHDFNRALSKELQNDTTLAELQSLFSDWLEELKLNYVQRSTVLDSHTTLAEVEQLHQAAQLDAEAANL